jgi:ankyrin repeat protein
MQAATRGHLLACTYLIASGADVNLATHDGWTALHKASNNGHFEIVKLLLDKGANRYAKYQDGNLPIDLAVKTGHTDIVDLLNTFESKKPLNLKQDIQ